MDHAGRMQLVGRITYDVGWVALVCGGLFHINVARGVFSAVGLPQRSLFELSIVCFVICMASELRARGQAA